MKNSKLVLLVIIVVAAVLIIWRVAFYISGPDLPSKSPDETKSEVMTAADREAQKPDETDLKIDAEELNVAVVTEVNELRSREELATALIDIDEMKRSTEEMFKNLSDEDKAAMEQARDRWNDMTIKEREEFRARMLEKFKSSIPGP
jgi:PDZ domain-containing secreted protein